MLIARKGEFAAGQEKNPEEYRTGKQRLGAEEVSNL